VANGVLIDNGIASNRGDLIDNNFAFTADGMDGVNVVYVAGSPGDIKFGHVNAYGELEVSTYLAQVPGSAQNEPAATTSAGLLIAAWRDDRTAGTISIYAGKFGCPPTVVTSPQPQGWTVVLPCFVDVVGKTAGAIDPHGVASIHVQTSTGTPLADKLVELDYTNPVSLRIAQSQPGMLATQPTCGSHRVGNRTDASGNARVHVVGGALVNPSPCPPVDARLPVYVDGVASSGSLPYRSFDLNGDLAVGSDDMSRWFGLYGCGSPYYPVADYDGSGVVGANDLSLWLARFGDQT